MATRLIGTDSNDPWLPTVVKARAVQSKIADLAGNFTSSDVEGALAELIDVVDTIVITGGSMPAASDAETIAGTLTTKAVTPAGLKSERAYVDVRTYGAKGDGATDDTAAINAAFTAVGAAGGGTVVFPAGYTFNVNASLVMKDRLSILGYGAEIHQTTINGATLDTSLPVSDVSIAGLRITGVHGAGAFGGRAAIRFQAGSGTGSRIRIADIVIDTVSTSGIALDNVQDVVISNVTVRRCAEHAFYVGSGSDVVVNGLVVREPGYNIGVSGFTTGQAVKIRAQHVAVSNFDLDGGTGSTGIGVLIEADGTPTGTSKQVSVTNGIITNFSAQGVRVNAPAEDVVIGQVIIKACGGGYRDLGSLRSSVQGCTIDSPAQPAIWYSVMVTDAVCIGNLIVASSNHGISILGTRCIVAGNKLLPGCGNAIAVNTGSVDVRVLDNQIHSAATSSAVAGTNIQVRNIGMGTDVTGAQIGFYGKTPIARPTVPAAATDPATTMALVNSLRTALVNLGLVA